MATSRLELLLHPVRLRLVHAMRAGGPLTTSDLCARLLDLPKATVYRQVERLFRGGVFELESTRQVRGAVERRYRLAEGGAVIDAEAARSMTLDDHRRGFTAAMAALIADFHAYLDRPGAEPTADQVSYRQYTVWLRPEERSRLIRELSGPLRALLERRPGDGRDPYLLSTIFFPSGPAPSKGDSSAGDTDGSTA
jgi:DNA-binding transcriptional ArsR family regulator